MVRKLTRKKTLKDIKHCSPHNNQKNLSCFDKKSLLKMIKSWNKHYKKNKINFNKNDTRGKLWHKLDTKMKDKCDSEYCWTSQVGLEGSDKSQLEDMFRPKMPEKWKKNPNEWLNTYDIQRVLRQYEKGTPNFMFIGAVPIDFDYEPSPGNCIVNELCRIKVDSLLKKGKIFLGVVFQINFIDHIILQPGFDSTTRLFKSSTGTWLFSTHLPSWHWYDDTTHWSVVNVHIASFNGPSLY